MALHTHGRKKKTKRSKGPTAAKAKKILDDGSVHGKRLTKRQKRFFGARSKS